MMVQMGENGRNSFDRSSIETHDCPDGSKWSTISSIETHDGPDGLE